MTVELTVVSSTQIINVDPKYNTVSVVKIPSLIKIILRPIGGT